MRRAAAINLLFVSIGVANAALGCMLFVDLLWRTQVQYAFGWPLVLVASILLLLLCLDRAGSRSFLQNAVILALLGMGFCYYAAVTARDIRVLLVSPLASCLVYIVALLFKRVAAWLSEEDISRQEEYSGTTLGAALVGLGCVFILPVGLAPTLLFYPPAVDLEHGRVAYDVEHPSGQRGIRVSADVQIRGYATVYDWTLAAFLVAGTWKERPDEPWQTGLPLMARLYRLQSEQLEGGQDKDFLTKTGSFFLPYSVVDNTTGQLAPSFTELYQPSSIEQVKRSLSPVRFSVEIFVLTFARAGAEPFVQSIGHIPLDGRTASNYGSFARSTWAKLIALSPKDRPAGPPPLRPPTAFAARPEPIESVEPEQLWTVVRSTRDGKVVAIPVSGAIPKVGSRVEIFFRSPAQNIDAVKAWGAVTSSADYSFTVIIDTRTQTGTIYSGDLIRTAK